MKKLIYTLILSLAVISFSCTGNILTSKEGDPLDPVENLDYALVDEVVTLTWSLPAQYPSDIIQPVSVRVDIYCDGNLMENPIVTDSPVLFSYNGYVPGKTYRFVVKVRGEVNTDDPYMATVRLSPGRIVAL